MAANQVTIVWEWMHNSGQWLPYDPEVSNFVEQHYEKWQQTANSRLSAWPFASQNQLAVRLKDVSSVLANYSIDFNSWSQINAINGQVRPVRRQEYDCSGSAGTGVQWQWSGDVVGEWQPYTIEVSDAIERARSNGVSAVDLNKFPFFLPYIVRLSTMEQIRSGTRFTRAIRCRVLSQPYKQCLGSPSSIVSHRVAKRQLTSSSGVATNGVTSNITANNSVANFVGASSVPSSFVFSTSAAFSSPLSGPIQMPSSSIFGSGVTADLRGGNAANIQPSNTNVFGSQQPSNTNVFGSQQPLSSGTVVNSSSASSGASNIAGVNTNGRPKRTRKLKTPATIGTNSGQSQSATQLQSTSPSLSPAASASASASSSAAVSQQLKAAGASGTFNNWFSSVTASSSSGSVTGRIANFISNTATAASSYFDSVTSAFGTMSLKRKSSSASTNPFSPPKQSRSAPYTASTAATVNRSVVRPQPTTKYTAVHQHFTNTANGKTRDILSDYIQVVSNAPKSEDCIICCDAVTEPSGYGGPDEHTVVKLVRCSHLFHLDCICAMYDSGTKDGSVQCPTCKQIYGVKHGNCPRGTMTYRLLPQSLSGYTDYKSVEIVYDIRSGTQDGVTYTARGFPRCGYLPNNDKGLQVLSLLIKAWQRRLTFTIGTSVTTGQSNVVVWNEIHHKTSMSNQDGHGYPDPNYLDNVLTELAAQGVTDDN